MWCFFVNVLKCEGSWRDYNYISSWKGSLETSIWHSHESCESLITTHANAAICMKKLTPISLGSCLLTKKLLQFQDVNLQAMKRSHTSDSDISDTLSVSENSDTPKSSILIRVFHYFHHPFWGPTLIAGNTHEGSKSSEVLPERASKRSKLLVICAELSPGEEIPSVPRRLRRVPGNCGKPSKSDLSDWMIFFFRWDTRIMKVSSIPKYHGSMEEDKSNTVAGGNHSLLGAKITARPLGNENGSNGS